MAELPFCSHHSEGETIRDMLVCQIKIPTPPKFGTYQRVTLFILFYLPEYFLNSITNKNNNKNKNKNKKIHTIKYQTLKFK